ncbi:Rieske 2Fe-2S domain-containing protein [Calothrix sp. UHCC 0171]|uniref:aromatic ring-hydroxylating dioxygenase subunit alpha n=1 Tax=Calothrix sp. UHCC 0171 TaxID=3110245 RepID=UPI002B1F8ECF|nr:Rieske 2Fe-2S domain-containing protein [Calothrix sp. UHCC 0171]MEA5571629.1 Rieske 2Fe-2S domain-containing protein [Calothrix sp. UHCC 0171]
MQTEFNFFQHWYPVIPIEDLDSQRPTPITILGMRLVIWKPKSSDTYQVFLDQCPHRLAPLSEGRIDDRTGNLMCSYHGWQFDSQGICTHIPQAENPEIVSKNKDNFCVTCLPIRQANDLLWVWLDTNSREIAENTSLPLSSKIGASTGFVWSSMVRDLEYDWQTLVENVADPSHVPFAHHGVQGNREKATPIPIQISQSTANLIEATIEKGLKSTITFQPPCRLEYSITFGNSGKQVGLVTYCIPVSPGKSRIIAQFPRNFAKTLHHFTPRWWNHITERNLVLDGDMVLLQQQEYLLQQRQTLGSWKTAYKMPTSADRLVIEFRQWFDKYAQGKLPWDKVGINALGYAKINQNREEVLNRYKQHTQHCSSCRGALKNIQSLQLFLLAYFVIIVTIVALMPDASRVKIGIPLSISALLGLGIYAILKLWLEPKFYFIDYIHAEK